ncbi:ribonuclease G [Thiohalophilus sp.]|uniref:ribonuclease G n=1 Tax=Thiohalophilus sp. TaxID=3028392 RepID=UPI002ACD257B|nr:ribonuclease G [Thiohalophilus sp.]MDZ7662238.1 ribonuclease G [Thiohalophilus sp.]
MSEELLINVTPQETRVAYVENGMLQEVHIERARKRGLVGNIYRGKVSRVLPGMQAAFIDMGLDRTAFLHVSDIAVHGDGNDEKNSQTIMELLREGQEVIAQVIKDPMGSKGARLTTQLSIPSRYLVYMPGAEHVGVSQKIDEEAERQRLKEIVARRVSEFEPGGYIVRTVAEGVSEEAILNDMRFLQKLWTAIQERSQISNGEDDNLLYEDLPLVMRTMRDLSGSDIEKVRIDSNETYERVKKFASRFIPNLVNQIEYYPGERPIFDLYGVEDEIRRALERKVQLKSGGYLIIDQTEAMTTIDVNTGAFVGHRNLEETIFKTNLEATQTIVRQLRLRNLGGIIIIDFIDMVDIEHRRQVLRALEKNLERDHAKNHISEVSSLGLVEMTRKRTRESLEHILCEPCSTCNGRGTLLTAETVCFEIFREILREARQFDAQQFLVLAGQPVVDMLLDEESTSVAELEEFIGKPIKFQVESEYTQEQFDVVLM